MQRVGILNGENNTYDKDLSQYFLSIANPGVISGLLVETNVVRTGKAIIKATRTIGEEVAVAFENTADVIIDTSIDAKVYIELTQANIDDGTSNNEDGTGIGSIKTGVSYPTSNFIPLASITAGVITDERNLDILKTTGLTQNIETSKQIKALEFIGDGSNLTGLSAEVTSSSLSVMMGSNGATPGISYSKEKYEQLIGTTANDVGSVAQPLVSQSFYGQTNISSIDLMVALVSSPSDDILIEIQGDNAGVPDGVAIGSSNIVNYTALTTTLIQTTFTFATAITITEGVLYHIVVKRSGANDTVNFYSVGSAGSDVQIGTMSTNDGTVYTNQLDDLFFTLPGYYLAKIGGTNFLGILQVAKNIGEIGKFNKEYDNNQNGLIPGMYYGYDKITGTIIRGLDFKAISETELNLILKLNKQVNFSLIAGEDIIDNDPLHFNIIDGKVYKTSTTKQNFIGFANGEYLSGTNTNVIIYGEVIGLTLIAGKQYYLQSDGTIGLITTSKFVGFAITSSILLKSDNVTDLIEGVNDVWTTKASMITPRSSLSASTVLDKIYCIGGYDGTNNVALNEEYDPITDTWTSMANMTTARRLLTTSTVSDKIYCIGGYDGTNILAVNEEYDPVANTWASKTSMITARSTLNSSVVLDKIYCIGGWDGTNYFALNEEYDPITDTWTSKTSMSIARKLIGTSTVSDKIYCIGGYDGTNYLVANEEYDPAVDTWTSKTSMSTARSDLVSSVVLDKIYCIGGYDGTNDLTINEEYDNVNDIWSTRTSMITARSAFSASTVSDKIYCIGGAGIIATNEEYS